jgi:putative membrane-bound dehydrogenase-like protein
MSMHRLFSITFLALLPLFGNAAEPGKSQQLRSPLSPQEALKHFRITPGLRLELVAAEPLIESPVAMAFDEADRLWVVEMRDYPNGPRPGEKPQGRIKVLSDRDGDGAYDHSVLFADHLLFANGLMLWRGGLVVTAAPHIVYLQDTDGDGKADKQEVLYEGFATENPQLRVSHPVLGIDNWVYVANGLRGGQVKRAGQPGVKPVNISNMDFRFDIVRDRHEAISGLGQYGNCFDDWGQRFVCDNRHHLRHIVIENRYLKRNPFLAAPAVVEDISVLEDGPLSSGGKIYPLSRNWTTSSLHVGRFTAACGVFIYRGDLLAPEYRGCAFTCDPTGNLVHQEVLRPRGATFRSSPPREGVEFLATPDDWFRPVFLSHGPDGAMYIVDMYRAVIEHPEFMPEELKNRPDLTLGKDRGRIWRVVPDRGVVEKDRGKLVTAGLRKASVEDLVHRLASPNAWERTTAQRLLLERQDRAAVKPLLAATTSPSALERLHAAWLLDGLGALEESVVCRLLEDPVGEVRTQAVQMAEHWLPASRGVQERVVRLADDVDPHVRYQAALSLGEWDDDRILEPLARIAAAGADDRWARLAAASAVPKRAGRLIAALLQPQRGLTHGASPDWLSLLHELAALVGARRDPEEVAGVLDALAALRMREAARWQMTGIDGLAQGMERRGTQLSAFLGALPASRRAAAERTTQLLTRAAAVAAAAKADPAERLTAVRLLAHAAWTTAQPVLTRLVTEEGPQDVRLAAVRALSAHPRAEVAALLMKGWPGYTPALRREVAEAMLRQTDRALHLLAEVEAGRVRPGDIDAIRTRQLVGHGRPEVRDKARKLLQDNLPAERKKVLDEYRAALTRSGEPRRGQAVFQKHCATCHRVAGLGVDVGPDIADTRTKTPEALLTDILNPNAAIDNNYLSYEVTLKNGKVLTGMIAAETASSLTIKRAENQADVVLRQDIEEVRSSGFSLMPEGLEKNIPVADMADLLSFLKNWRYLDGTVPLGEGGRQGKR